MHREQILKSRSSAVKMKGLLWNLKQHISRAGELTNIGMPEGQYIDHR